MQLKFITLNLENGGSMIERAAEFILHEKPDILFLQEAYNGLDTNLPERLRSVTVLQNASKFEHSSFAPAFFELSQNLERGNAILSRFPFSLKKAINFVAPYEKIREYDLEPDYRMSPRILQSDVVEINGTSVKLLNMHGAWDFHGNDTEVRFDQSKLLLNEFDERDIVITAGDFNMFPETKAIALIEQRLENVFGNSLRTTFNMKRKESPSFATAVVDMVFISKHFKVIQKNCPQIDISDHLPLVVVLDLAT